MWVTTDRFDRLTRRKQVGLTGAAPQGAARRPFPVGFHFAKSIRSNGRRTHGGDPTACPRACEDRRGGRDDRGRRDRRVGGTAQEGAAGVPDLRSEARAPRPRADQAAGSHGPGEARVPPGARARQRAVGEARVQAHARLRGLGRVPGGEVPRARPLAHRASGVARRGRHPRGGLRRDRGAGGRRALRRAGTDRRRRDRLQEGPRVPDRRRRPRPGTPRLGPRGVRQGGAGPLPRRARARAATRHRGRGGRRGQVDKGAGQARVPQRPVGHGPIPRGRADERRARRGRARGAAGRQEGRPRRDAEARRARQAARGRGDPAGGQGAEGGCGRDQGKPLRAGEEPGGPHGAAAGEARRAREGGASSRPGTSRRT